MKFTKSLFIILVLALFAVPNADAQKKKKKNKEETPAPEKKKEDKNGIKPYDEIITEERRDHLLRVCAATGR